MRNELRSQFYDFCREICVVDRKTYRRQCRNKIKTALAGLKRKVEILEELYKELE